MTLTAQLRARAAAGRPVRVLLVGCGKFATMFLAQLPTTPGIEVGAIVDLLPERVPERLQRAGWSRERIRRVAIGDDLESLLSRHDWDVVVEATGDPLAGVRHALAAIARGLHLVMVNVEADALCGPALARRARERGCIYSLAWGDQPALVCDLVDWAESCGFAVVAAGKGTKYLPHYHASTPETVWEHYGIEPEAARRAGMNAKMFNSFLDGTKSAIEMAAVANATGLAVPEDGLGFPPAGTAELATVLRPCEEGGVLARRGMVEVVSSLRRDGTPIPDDLRWGVYVVVEAPCAYSAACFREYGMITDPSGRFAALWRPYHLIGLELAVSVARVALEGRSTGTPQAWHGDVVACAKRDLAAGEVLDGEGGRCVWGRLVPAARAAAEDLLPIGLAHDLRLRRAIPAGTLLRFSDVEPPPASEALTLRRELEPAPRPEDPEKRH